jgi:Uma2 family endonuclease
MDHTPQRRRDGRTPGKELVVAQRSTLPPLVRGEWLPMTYEEFLDWSEGMHAEWVDGEGIIFVSASDRHQWTIALLYELLARFVLLFDLGRVVQAPFAMRFGPRGPHREPDVLFLAKAHLDRWTPTGITGPADFAAEVISDDSVDRDHIDKLRAYAELGVPEYLIIDPRPERFWFGLRRLDASGVYRLVEPDERGRVSFESLPGFWLDPRWFEQDPLAPAERLLFAIAGDAYLAWLMRQREASESDR